MEWGTLIPCDRGKWDGIRVRDGEWHLGVPAHDTVLLCIARASRCVECSIAIAINCMTLQLNMQCCKGSCSLVR